MLFLQANRRTVLTWLSILLAGIPLLIGIIALVGWIFDWPKLLTFGFGWYPIQFNTALAIIFSACSVLLLPRNKALASLMALPTLLITLLTLIEYLFGLNLYIDSLFGYGNPNATFPGRMAPNTALCLLLLNFSLTIYLQFRSRTSRFIQMALVCLVFGLAVLALIGNIFNIRAIYLWSGLTSMALHTAFSILLLCSSLMLILLSRYRRFYVGFIETMAIAVFGSLLFILLWQFLMSNANLQLQKKLENTAQLVANEIEIVLLGQYQAVNRFFNRFSSDQVQNIELQNDAHNYLKDMPDLLLLQWSDGSVSRGNIELLFTPQQLNIICADKAPGKASLFSLNTQEENRTLLCMVNKNRQAFAVFDINGVITNIIRKDAAADMNWIVRFKNRVIYSQENIDASLERRFQINEQISWAFLDAPLTIKMWPTVDYVAANLSWFPFLFLIFGLVITFLLAWINYLKHKIFLKNTHLRRLIWQKNHRLLDIESKYERIYDYSPDMQLFIDNKNNIVECNETFVDTMGYFRKNGILGRNVFDILHLTDENLQRQIEARIKNSGVMNNIELKLMNLHQKICVVMLKGSPFINKQRELIGYSLSFRDISDIHALKKELKAREYSVNLFKENIALYDLILDETTDGWWDINVETQQCRLSKKLLNSLGFEESTAHVNANFFKEYVIAEDFLIIETNLKKHIVSRGFHPFKQEVRFKHRNGSILWIFCRGQGIVDPDGQIRRVVGTNIDITPLKQTQAKLSKKIKEMDLIDQSTRLILMADNIDNALQNCLSLIGNCAQFSKGILYRLDTAKNTMTSRAIWQKDARDEPSVKLDFMEFSFQISEGNIGKSWREGRTVLSENLAEDALAFRHNQWNISEYSQAIAIPILLSEKVEAIFEYFTVHNTVIEREEINLFDILAAQLSLALDRKKNHYLLQHLALHDELTQLPNRRACLEMLELTLSRAERNKTRFALMFLDLDGFKEVNDSFGHPVGDRLLIEVANLFKKAIRGQDYLARLGGDEFVVVITDLYSDDLLYLLANRLKNSLARPLVLDNNLVKVSVSIGFVTYPESGKTTEEILKRADHAMYRVKQEGKNNFYGL